MSLLVEEHVRERMHSRLAEAEYARRARHVAALRRAEKQASRAKARLARVRLRHA